MNPQNSSNALPLSSLAQVTPEEYRLLQQLRARDPAQNPPKNKPTLGERVADRVADSMGSWQFIIIQSTILALWVSLNAIGLIRHWDPYPFILLNLMLSFQAAYAAPIIMMSQNRQSDIDRIDARHNFEVNLKAELEIELLQDKMDALQQQDMPELASVLQAQLAAQRQQLDRLELLLRSHLNAS